MNEKEFEQLVKEKENKDIEFKSELPEPKKVAQLVIALYNSRGGKIVLGVKDDEKDDYVPLSRNKTIIEVFGKLGIMDKRGTGFLRIREAMKKNDLPKPEFKEKTGYFLIRFVNPAIENIPIIEESKLNERQNLFFEKITKEKITTQDYIEITKCTKRTAIRDLDRLVKLNLITQRGPVTGRGRYYIIKVTKGDKR